MSYKANTASARGPKPPKDLLMKKSNPHARLKIIVRRLPPNLPESLFWQSVQSWVSEETVSWKEFYGGKLRKKIGKENVPSTAYLLFRNEECLATFSREYNGHIFRDKQGNESYAVVEFAPNPKVPPEKKKVDSRHATIQQDEDYLSFIASLQNPPEKHEIDMDALLASTVPSEEPKITPLLAALREQKEQQKAVVQEKKILINDAKASRKNATAAISSSATSSTPGVTEPPTVGRKGKKGKGKDLGPAPPPPTTATGKGRNRVNQTAGSSQPPAGPSKEKETPSGSGSGSVEYPASRKEKDKERQRPVVGLGSRHLKAALSGAGVQVPSATSPSLLTSTSSVPSTASASVVIISGSDSAALTSTTVRPSKLSGSGTELPARGRGGGGGGGGREKRGHEAGAKEGGHSQGGGRGGGGGGGKEKRHRPPSSSGPLGPRSADAPPPRILTRQDIAPTGVVGGAEPPSSGERPSGGESGNSRGGGGRSRGGGRRDRGA